MGRGRTRDGGEEGGDGYSIRWGAFTMSEGGGRVRSGLQSNQE